MKVILHLNSGPVEAEFNPEKAAWKSRNYGWFTPDGVHFPEINKTLFVKRLSGRPASFQFLKSQLTSPCSEHIPIVYGLYEGERRSKNSGLYLFLEKLKGVTLNSLRGEIDISHCHEILSAVFKAVKEIAGSGYWYTDLDFSNVFIGQGESGFSVRLIDIDSCVPVSVSFAEYIEDTSRRLNVNERYWSYITYTSNGKSLDRLAGRALSKAALMYFAVDLFFNIKYPDRIFSITPLDLRRIMKPANKKYFTARAKRLWHWNHNRIRANPEKGVKWAEVDRFITEAYRFPHGLARPGMRGSVGDVMVDSVVNAFERIFGWWE